MNIRTWHWHANFPRLCYQQVNYDIKLAPPLDLYYHYYYYDLDTKISDSTHSVLKERTRPQFKDVLTCNLSGL